MTGIKCINPHEPVTPQDAYRTVDQMSGRENRKLGYSADEKLLRLVGQSFMHNESD